jgi:hypothetical protein
LTVLELRILPPKKHLRIFPVHGNNKFREHVVECFSKRY